jgi:hypothetical protein
MSNKCVITVGKTGKIQWDYKNIVKRKGLLKLVDELAKGRKMEKILRKA